MLNYQFSQHPVLGPPGVMPRSFQAYNHLRFQETQNLADHFMIRSSPHNYPMRDTEAASSWYQARIIVSWSKVSLML